MSDDSFESLAHAWAVYSKLREISSGENEYKRAFYAGACVVMAIVADTAMCVADQYLGLSDLMKRLSPLLKELRLYRETYPEALADREKT